MIGATACNYEHDHKGAKAVILSSSTHVSNTMVEVTNRNRKWQQ